MLNIRLGFLCLSLSSWLIPTLAVAGGEVTSRPCPYSCRLAGIPKSHCKDYRNGNTCYVEDMSKPARAEPPRPPAAQPPAQPRPAASRHGYVTYNNCPYKCATVGIPKQDCRDWRDGDYCYIEDLTRSQGGPVFVGRNTPPPPAPRYDPEPRRNEPPAVSGECRDMGGRYLARPRVNLYKVKKSGGMFGDKYRVRGSVEGVCLVEAGYFESGRKKEEIPVAPGPSFHRFEFEVEVRGDRDPEIRVYNVNGDSAFARVEDELDDSQRGRDDYGSGYRR